MNRYCNDFIRSDETLSNIDNEEKDEVNSLKENYEDMEAEEVIRKEEEIKVKVGNKKSSNAFSALLNSINSLNARVNRVDEKMKKSIKESIKKVKSYQLSSNVFNSNAYASQKNRAQKSLNKLKGLSSTTQTDNNKGFFQPKLIIPVALGVVVLGVVVAMVIRSRRMRKRK